MTPCDTKSIVDWLTDGARSAPRPEMVLADLCDQLVHDGIPLWPAAGFARPLHPEIMGRRFIWQPGGDVTITEGLFDLLETDQFRNSPFVAVIKSGRTIRRQLQDQGNPEEFSIFRDLRAEGATDYLATPLIFTDGSVHVATWSTQQVGGFTDAQIAGIETIVRPLARVAEIRALQRTATNLLDTYVGHHAGERILAGRIRRGHTETTHSVIWLSGRRSTLICCRRTRISASSFALDLKSEARTPRISLSRSVIRPRAYPVCSMRHAESNIRHTQPVIGRAIVGIVLAHRRDHDAVRQRETAQRDGRKKDASHYLFFLSRGGEFRRWISFQPQMR